MKAYRFFLPSRLFAGNFDAAGNAIGIEAGQYLPANGAWAAPTFQEGFWPRRTTDDSAWEQVEDHRGEQGYVNGVATTITDVGPYPVGWSTTPPAPTDEEQYNTERAVVEAKYSAPWNGTTGGVLTLLQMTSIAALASGQDTTALYAQYNTEVGNMQAEFETIDEKYGVA